MNYAEASYSRSAGLPSREPVFSNSVLGIIVFIMTETMFFVALISAYLISTAGVVEWPPADQPRLPVEATGFNSLILLASGVVIYYAGKVFEAQSYSNKSEKLLLLAIGLGTFFVVFQGFEWARLLSFGLTVTSGVYGAFFYLIIGAHAVHVFGAILGLARLFVKMRRRTLTGQSYRAGQIFWYFVVGVWPALYGLVYLS